ncbi:MAG: sulfate adenylyltransferase [Bacillota bacterium]
MNDPHGGYLVELVADQPTRQDWLAAHSQRGHSILEIDGHQLTDLENLASGVYSPLTGYMDRLTLESVLVRARLANGLPWTMPIVLDADDRIRQQLLRVWGSERGRLILAFRGQPVAGMAVREIYEPDRATFISSLFGTEDPGHPGVTRALRLGRWFLAGDVVKLASTTRIGSPVVCPPPRQVRALLAARGWKRIVAFQTRNVPHLGHEYIQKTALTLADGLLIQPVIGRKKPGDFRDEIIIGAYQRLLEGYYPAARALLAPLSYEMRYAGPKEAIHHALMRKNFGCTHFIVGRDHAGVGCYYGPYEAQEYFREFPDLGITPLPFEEAFYCARCQAVANSHICPHPESERFSFSGTRLRQALETNSVELERFLRPEIAAWLRTMGDPFVQSEEGR